MKLKFYTFLLMVGLSFSVASAQFRWGAEAGANISHALSTSDTRIGFNVGLTGEYNFKNNWFIDAAVKLSSQPVKDQYNVTVPQLPNHQILSTEIRSYTPYYLSIPIRVGYGLNVSRSTRLTLALGPQFGVGLFGHGEAIGNRIYGIEKIDNIFSQYEMFGYSTSRFQYGGNIRLAATFENHIRLAAEYSLLHITGSYKAVDNISLFSINLGYVF